MRDTKTGIGTRLSSPCDSSDTMFYGALLPADLEVGDRLYIGSAGAYTTSYASSFNGFPPPRTLFTDGDGLPVER